MKRTYLWIMAAILVLGALYLLFFYRPGARSELASRGIRGYGQIQAKDSRPGMEGETIYVVTFIYQDEQKRNHMVTRPMYDAGRWNDLKVGQDVRVTYLPENPDAEASIEGAEGLASPKSSALSFLAWSALIAGLLVGYMAWKAPGEPGKPQGKGPVVAHR